MLVKQEEFSQICWLKGDLEGWVRTKYLTFSDTEAAPAVLAPCVSSLCFAEFKLPASDGGFREGMRISPGRATPILELPLELRSHIVRMVVLEHRKDLDNADDMASWPQTTAAILTKQKVEIQSRRGLWSRLCWLRSPPRKKGKESHTRS